MPSREKDSADFDLEAFIDLFDEAISSDDPSVQKTLQHLMVIAALARNHARHDHRDGPMRRMFENQRDLTQRLSRLESELESKRVYPGGGLGGSGPPSPYAPGIVWPSSPGTYPPGTIWAQNQTSTSVTLDPMFGAIPPVTATSMVAEHVQDLLKSPNYKGSSVGANDKE
jgi:hypothetical protein